MNTPLKPLNPILHASYAAALHADDLLPPTVRDRVNALVAERNTAQDTDAIDRELASLLCWYALRPDEIVGRIMLAHGSKEPLTVAQATVILAALGEAGYPITGNGAPDYRDSREAPPVRGAERDRVIWAAASHWAQMASRTYVSLGDCRGFCPRAVQYDQPGSIHPTQLAAVTFGPEAECHKHMLRHTRRLILVRAT